MRDKHRITEEPDEVKVSRPVLETSGPREGLAEFNSSRMGTYPETTKSMATLLKKQKGKCTYCGLYFREEDVLEIDHITPRSLGGKDEYKNLQILHRHCHDVKTTEDGSVVKYT